MATTRRRARVLAVIMAATMVVHALPLGVPGWALAAVLIVAALAASAGDRRRERERRASAHRSIGAVLMAAAILAHPASSGAAAHAHGVPAEALVVASVAAYGVWSLALARRGAHATPAMRVEIGAMAVMLAVMTLPASGVG
ncbi:hypothetical protein [Microbacterium sp. JZ31]|uniref:hypothetical protein n=1 Tax=Microbacterium sp. JZ31 TaxID=1906274 RepID=UPI001931E497|nr:hypothetical protein [Microbacterium sp. JZ31]